MNSDMATAVVEPTMDRAERRCALTYAMEWHELSPPRVAVRHLERIGLGTSYVAGVGVERRAAG